ncbi:MAG: S-layer homology domain-containing protein [Clostridia bacterium]|nr:S-layer homology domain-containing protein [Clostridia bacterium]
MRNIAKRTLALVLSFVMILTSLPTIASAATNDPLKQTVKVGESISLYFPDGTLLEPSSIKANGKYNINEDLFETKGHVPTGVKATAKTGTYTVSFTNKAGELFTWEITIVPANEEPRYDYTFYGRQSVTLDPHQGNDYIDGDTIKVSNSNVLKTSYNGFLDMGVDEVTVESKNVGTSNVEFESYSWVTKYLLFVPYLDKDKYNKNSYSFKVVESDTVLNGTINDTIYVGDKINLNITAAPAANQGAFISAPTVSYESSNDEIAKIENGKLVAVAPGTVTITANASNGKTGDAYTGNSKNFEVTVKAGEVEKVEITNKVEKIKNTDTPDFNANVTVKGDVSQEVIWSVSDENVATIDQDGKLTAKIGNASVRVTATSAVDDTKSDSFDLRIDWNSNGGNSKYEHINVLVKDDKGEVVEGATVNVELQQLFGRKKVFGPYYSNEEGKTKFNFDSYEYINWASAEKEGYEKATVKVDKYIGLFAGENEYITITMHKIQKYDVVFQYVDEEQNTTEFNKVTVNENTVVEATEIEKAKEAAEAFVEELNKENPDYTYTFEGFDNDLTEAITDNTTVNATISKIEKAKIAVIAAYKFYDEYTKYEDIAEEYRYKVDGNEESYKLADTKAHFERAVYGKIEDGKLVEQDKEEATNLILVYWSKKADIKFVDEDNKEIDDAVIGLEDFNFEYTIQNGWFKENKSELTGIEYSDLKQTENMWKPYAKNISIDDENEYKFINAKISSYNETRKYNYNYPVITLVYKKAIKKPVNVKHVLYFEGQAVKTVSEAVKSVIYVDGEEVSVVSNGKVNEAYKKYALEGYTLDEFFSGSNCMTYDYRSNTITYRYWAKRITVAKAGKYQETVPGFFWGWTWVPEHKEDRYFDPNKDREVIYLNYNEIGTLDTNKDTYKDITLSNGKNIYDGFESAGDLYKVDKVKVDLELPVSTAIWEFYKATITLTYAYDVQGNCKHEHEKYIDNKDGETHKVICADCDKVLKEAEKHEFNENDVCKKCGYTNVSPLDDKLANKTFNIPAGITKLNFNSELFTKLYVGQFGEYAKDINAYDEEKYNDEKASVIQLDADDIFAIFEDKTPEAVLDADENIIGVKFNNLVLPTYYGVNHELNITFNYNGSLYIGQLEESTTNTYSLILPKDISRVENKIKDLFSYTVNNAETKIFNITIDNNNKVYNIINDYIQNDLYREEIIVLDNDNEFSFTAKLHVNKSGKKRKPKNDPNNIIPDDPMPQAGPILNDLRTNRPNDSLTRSEFVAVLSQLFQVMDTGNYKDFNDIENDPNKAAIQKMSSFEIVKGYVDGSFGPNDFMTREQMYAILARAIKFSGKASALTDEQIATELAKVLDGESVSDWAKIDVATAIEQGIVGADTVNALSTITRAETADKLEKFIAVIATESEEIKD